MFSHITAGYTPSSFVRAIDQVLTQRRQKNLDMRPLQVEDFVGPLSNSYSCSTEEYASLRDFNDVVTGVKDRRNAKSAPDDGGKGKAKPGKKK